MSEYMVVRGLHRYNGWWFDRSRMPVAGSIQWPDTLIKHKVVLGPTGMFEIREDGERAEVYRPVELA